MKTLFFSAFVFLPLFSFSADSGAMTKQNCLDLEALLTRQARFKEQGGEVAQTVTDLRFSKGFTPDHQWLREYGEALFYGPLPIDPNDFKQLGCRRVLTHDGVVYEITDYSPVELMLEIDEASVRLESPVDSIDEAQSLGDAIWFALSRHEGLKSEFEKKLQGKLSGLKVRVTQLNDKAFRVVATPRQFLTSEDGMKVEREIVVHWGNNPSEVVPTSKTEALLEDYLALVEAE